MSAHRHTFSWCFAAMLMLSACTGGSSPAQSSAPVPGVGWRASVDGNSIYGLIWAETGWVAVGSSGMVLTSPDGISWTNHKTPSLESLNAIAWSGTRFVAVGGDNLSGIGGTILTSTDAVEWTVQYSAPSTLTGIVWSGTQFVAVGWGGTIVTSPDGLEWTSRASGASTFLLGVAWSGSTFVAVGWTILTSPDGVTWTEQRTGVPDTLSLRAVTWTGSLFVAVGQSGMLLTSPDAVTWTSRSVDTLSTLKGVASSGNGLVAVGDEVYTSSNGLSWTMSSGASPSLNGVAWSGTEYVAVGDYGSVKASPDGSAWENRVAPPSNSLRGLAWSGEAFVAVGDWGTILTSSDGESWTSRDAATRQWLTSVIWTGTRFVAVGAGWDGQNQLIPAVLTSTDGVAWASAPTEPNTYSLTGIVKSEALSEFVAVGGYGAVLSSPDGTNWTKHDSTASCGLTGVAALGTRLVSVGSCNTIIRSEDGAAWTAQDGGVVGDAFFGIVATPHEFLIVGRGASAQVVTLTSSDGVTWTRRTPPLENTLNAVSWIGDRFIGVGRSGSIVTSPDGETWTVQVGATPPWCDLYAVAGNANRLVAVGYQGTIETSP